MSFIRYLRAQNYDLVCNSSWVEPSDSESHQTSECEHLLSSVDRELPEDSEEMSASEPSAAGERSEVEAAIPPPKPDMYAPPPYEEVEYNPSPAGVSSIPPYNHSTGLQPPSYEEVQRQKALEAGEDPLQITDPSGNGVQVVRISSLGGLDPQTAEIAEEQLLGTDFMFFVAFTAAFLFNLVGIVLLLCLCHTVAGRTGALAGFGLSLAKWVVIFRHSTGLVADSNSWLFGLIMVLGLLICVRAILQYINAKREWHQLPHGSRHRFFLFY